MFQSSTVGGGQAGFFMIDHLLRGPTAASTNLPKSVHKCQKDRAAPLIAGFGFFFVDEIKKCTNA